MARSQKIVFIVRGGSGVAFSVKLLRALWKQPRTEGSLIAQSYQCGPGGDFLNQLKSAGYLFALQKTNMEPEKEPFIDWRPHYREQFASTMLICGSVDFEGPKSLRSW